MDKTLRKQLLKTGGKQALQKYNSMRRIPPVQMNTGTRVHVDRRWKDPKHKKIFEKE